VYGFDHCGKFVSPALFLRATSRRDEGRRKAAAEYLSHQLWNVGQPGRSADRRAKIKHRIALAFWLAWVAAIVAATAATLAARLIGTLIAGSPGGRAGYGLSARLARPAQSRSFLIAGSTCAVFLMAVLWGAAWSVGLVSGPTSLIRLGRP
jgi:hypothetical protein